MQAKYCCATASLLAVGVPAAAGAAAARRLAEDLTVATLAIPCMDATCKA